MPLCRCISSLGCPELSLAATLDLAVKHEIPLVELRALGGSVDLPAYFTAEYGSPERLAVAVRRSSVRVVAFNASWRLVGGTDAERAQLEALVPWAEALGVRWLRVFDGGQNADTTECSQAAAAFQWWRKLRSARGWQVDIMVETHDSLLSAEKIGRFLAAVQGAAVLWDAHHTWRKGGEDPLVTWRAIGDAVVHVHVKDSVPIASARHPFTYVLPGGGEFPVAPLLAVLRADAFGGPVSLEWEKQWHPYLPSLDEALHLAAQRGWW
uniref:sugar phosphate isomerase/epimerase family protein n=1 Tax=Horticoccus sp. 23ND18S-11 TaxID=3391832 RepID=UPI0039C8CF2B